MVIFTILLYKDRLKFDYLNMESNSIVASISIGIHAFVAFLLNNHPLIFAKYPDQKLLNQAHYKSVLHRESYSISSSSSPSLGSCVIFSSSSYNYLSGINIFIIRWTIFFQIISNFLSFVSQILQIIILLFWHISNIKSGSNWNLYWEDKYLHCAPLKCAHQGL